MEGGLAAAGGRVVGGKAGGEEGEELFGRGLGGFAAAAGVGGRGLEGEERGRWCWWGCS